MKSGFSLDNEIFWFPQNVLKTLNFCVGPLSKLFQIRVGGLFFHLLSCPKQCVSTNTSDFWVWFTSYFILENKCWLSACIRLPAHNNKIKRRCGANFVYGANFCTALINIFRHSATLIYFEAPNEKRLLFPWKMREKSRKSRKTCKNSQKNARKVG